MNSFLANVPAVLLLAAALSSCTRSTKESAADSLHRARDQALVHIADRYAWLADYSLRGLRCLSACAGASPQIQHFSLQLRAPGLFLLDLPDEQQKIAFDGHDFVTLDAESKTVRRVTLAAGKDADLAKNSMLPFQLLSRFVVEGWRAPPLNTAHAVPAQWLAGDKNLHQHKALILSRPLNDVDLDRVEYIYRWPQIEFWQKRFVDKQGRVRKRVVVEKSRRSKAGGAVFPVRWVSYDSQEKVLQWTELQKIAINQGVAKAHFALAVPSDFVPLR